MAGLCTGRAPILSSFLASGGRRLRWKHLLLHGQTKQYLSAANSPSNTNPETDTPFTAPCKSSAHVTDFPPQSVRS